MNDTIPAIDIEREKNRMMKYPTFIIVDYVRGLVHKVMRDNEEYKTVINKKDAFYIMNATTDIDADELLKSKDPS
jgi:hypothetical protein